MELLHGWLFSLDNVYSSELQRSLFFTILHRIAGKNYKLHVYKCMLLFQTRFLIPQLIMFYSHRRFNHHRWPSSGTVSSLLARWRGEQTVPHVTSYVAPSSLFIVVAIFIIQMASLIQRTHSRALALSRSRALALIHPIHDKCL